MSHSHISEVGDQPHQPQSFKFPQREFALLSAQFVSDSISGNVKSKNFPG